MTRTIRVRVAVAVDESGDWYAAGWDAHDVGNVAAAAARGVNGIARLSWIEATIPVPESVTVEGEVVDG